MRINLSTFSISLFIYIFLASTLLWNGVTRQEEKDTVINESLGGGNGSYTLNIHETQGLKYESLTGINIKGRQKLHARRRIYNVLRCIVAINEHKVMDPKDERLIMGKMMIQLAKDVIVDQNARDRKVVNARYDNAVTAAFEIGYMTQVIQEHYRRMLDKWYSARRDITVYYNMEITLYLEEIEHLYWSIKHEVYMLHEIERKYKIKEDMNQTYLDPSLGATRPFPTQPPLWKMTKTMKQIKPNKLIKEAEKIKKGGHGDPELENLLQGGPMTTKRPLKTRWPHEYGWDVYDWR